jgi:hypothetical protein
MDNEQEQPLEEVDELRRGPAPSPALESTVIDALRQEGLIRTNPVPSWLARIAASLMVFALGAAAGHYLLPEIDRPQGAPARPRYMLLLTGDVAPPLDGSTRAIEYGNWARSLGDQGISISGDELSSHVEVVSNQADARFPDLTSVGGYFVIEASDDVAAAALARTCPHIRYGGSIVIRRIQ